MRAHKATVHLPIARNDKGKLTSKALPSASPRPPPGGGGLRLCRPPGDRRGEPNARFAAIGVFRSSVRQARAEPSRDHAMALTPCAWQPFPIE